MPGNKEIEFPDFSTIQDFSDWVDSLSEKEIQSWRAKDWNKMYEKLFAVIDKSSELEAEIPQFLEKREIDLKMTEFSPKELELAKRLIFLEQPKGMMVLAKLYANYRMEPEQFKKVYELATAAGKKAAETGEVSAARTWIGEYKYRMGTNEKNVSTLLKDAKLIENIVYEQSSYPERLEELGYERDGLRADIKTNNSPFQAGGIISASMHRKPKMEISRRIGDDAPLDVIFHESAHAHLQTFKYGLIDKVATIQPVAEFDIDFVQLMTNNEILPLIQAPTKKAYQRQPIEYFAHFYGYIAERSFRRESGQLSERALPIAMEYLSRIDEKLGKSLIASNDKEGNIVFTFPSSDWKKKLENLFMGEGNPWTDKIKIEKDNKNNTVMRMKYVLFPEKTWQDWEMFQARELVKAFTSKNEFQIQMGTNGCAKIEFSKKLPYTNEEIKKKIKGCGLSIDKDTRILTIPSIYSKEFNQLLNLFQKSKIGWIEAEQKRDAIRRYRRMRLKRIAKNLGFGNHTH